MLDTHTRGFDIDIDASILEGRRWTQRLVYFVPTKRSDRDGATKPTAVLGSLPEALRRAQERT